MDKTIAIEVYQTPDGNVTYYLSHVEEKFTTGVLVIKPGVTLTKHNRPLSFENITQVFGKCDMTLFDENDKPKDYVLSTGEGIKMFKGQWHIHANPYDEISITVFKADGNILDAIEGLRKAGNKLDNSPKNL